MSAIGFITIIEDTRLYSSNSSSSEVKCILPIGTIAHIDESPSVKSEHSNENKSFFRITVIECECECEEEKGWIENNSSHYQYND